jgi:hypothetical protein
MVPQVAAARRLSRLEWGAAGLLGLAAVWAHGLRLAHAGGLWRDEAGAVRLALQPALRDVFRLFPHEAFPLAVPVSIRLYARLAGDGDLALRGFGLAVGLAVTAALFVAAHASGRTQPLLSLALVAGNAPFMVFGDSLRGYGLGSCFLLICFAALARLLASPGPWPATAALAAALGAVHSLLGNAALVAALCVAAALAALRRGRRRVALAALGTGLAAGVSLLPYLVPLHAARSWNDVVVYRTGLRHIVTVLLATLGPAAGAWLALLGIALFAAFRPRVSQAGAVPPAGAAAHPPGMSGISGVDETPGEVGAVGEVAPVGAVGPVAPIGAACAAAPAAAPADLAADDVRWFCGLALVLGIAAQLLFLDVLSYTPRAWYDLPLLALMAAAIEPLVASLCVTPWARAARIAAALLLAAVLLPASLPRLRMRMTNADLVARRLAASASAGDLVLVCPWYMGVSFARYYRGPAGFRTLPDLADHSIHRYDLLRRQLASLHPIDGLLADAGRALRGGHRVWVVGELRVPPPGQTPIVLPPAPATAWGWNDFPYGISWQLQLGALLRDHAASLRTFTVPAADPVSPLETMTLAAAEGWR